MKMILFLLFCCVMGTATSFAQGSHEYENGMKALQDYNLEEAKNWFHKSGELGNAEGWFAYAETCELNFERSFRQEDELGMWRGYWMAQKLGCQDINKARDKYAQHVLERSKYLWYDKSVRKGAKYAQLWLQKGVWKFKSFIL